jgi:hypothetical protein
MIKWLIGISAFLAANPSMAQLALSDTVSFSFELADWHKGDTVYLHPAGPTTLRRFYNKNFRGVYLNDITPVQGTVRILFYVDSAGKFAGACNEESSDPALALEVLRVTSRLSGLTLIPTTAGGKPFASAVSLRVTFKKASESPVTDDPNADLTVHLYDVVY